MNKILAMKELKTHEKVLCLKIECQLVGHACTSREIVISFKTCMGPLQRVEPPSQIRSQSILTVLLSKEYGEKN